MHQPKVKRILIVDDELPVRSTLQRVLERDGCRVATADNWQGALKKVIHTKYDVVITDLNMPVMKGDELAQALKQHDPSIRIVLFTEAPPAEKPPAVDCVIQKPVTVPDLRSLLAPFLHPRSST